MNPSKLAVVLASLLATTGAQADTNEGSDVEVNDRGSPAEYDPGPSADSDWPKLMANTPNFRALGKEVIGGSGEKFRWTFGPMHYRGRLGENEVKVFVIGQEGAQDESLSNRSFTGGTGGKMQNFLRTIGLNRSYLFMNTFAYTINGQYTDVEGNGGTPDTLFWLAQNPKSPIVKHRHEMFDYMLSTNKKSLALVVAVGTAARDSLKTWVEAHGGRCKNVNSDCDGEALGKGIRVLHVPHPGAVGKDPTALPRLRKAFTDAADKVAKWEAETRVSGRASWLPADSGVSRDLRIVALKPRFIPAYKYVSAAVPHRDFAFGTSPRLGFGSTSSNRKDDQESIQLFAAKPAGCYNADCGTPEAPKRVPLTYVRPNDEATSIAGMPAGEIEWEAPRSNATAYDPGPGEDFAQLITGNERGFEYPDFARLGVTSHSSFGLNGIYRGRLDDAKLLVIADQESNDDIFTGRALTGGGGQRLQTRLNEEAGLSYAILRTIPVDTLDLTTNAATKIALDPKLVKVRKEIVKRILAKRKTDKVLIVGPIAKEVAAGLDFGGLEVEYQFDLPVRGAVTPIPREDLYFHTRWWVGTSGTRSARPLDKLTRKPHVGYYKIYMPTWVSNLKPKALSSSERAAVADAPRN